MEEVRKKRNEKKRGVCEKKDESSNRQFSCLFIYGGGGCCPALRKGIAPYLFVILTPSHLSHYRVADKEDAALLRNEGFVFLCPFATGKLTGRHSFAHSLVRIHK